MVAGILWRKNGARGAAAARRGRRAWSNDEGFAGMTRTTVSNHVNVESISLLLEKLDSRNVTLDDLLQTNLAFTACLMCEGGALISVFLESASLPVFKCRK